MILVFLGPPYSGKGTQAKLLAKQLKIPVFSMGLLIREAYEKKDPKAVKGYEQYAMRGMHLPNKLKFHLLKEKLDKSCNPQGTLLSVNLENWVVFFY